jgi:hypothetical protein
MSSTTMKQINEEINSIRVELRELKAKVDEDFELSQHAKEELKKARAEKDFISHEEVMKRFV